MLHTLTVILALIGTAAIALVLIIMRGTISMSGVGEDDGHGQGKAASIASLVHFKSPLPSNGSLVLSVGTNPSEIDFRIVSLGR